MSKERRLLIFFFLQFFVNLAAGFSKYANFLPLNQKRNSETTDDLICDTQLDLFSEALAVREYCAFRLFDTWGKVQSGIFQGNRYNLGHFSECLNFRHDIKTDKLIQGQYCLVGFTATQSSTITNDNKEESFDWREIGDLFRNHSLVNFNGVCLPATCSPQKVIGFANKFLQRAGLNAIGAYCKTSDPIKFEPFDIFAIALFSFFIILVITSTAYDYVTQQNGIISNKLLISFSAYTNGQKLFDMTKSKSPDSIDCLLGLRSMSLLWIIFGHRFINQRLFPLTNLVAGREHYNHIYSVILSSYDIAVDTFFVMGGLLLTISTLKALDKKCLNIPRMILHRYIRYTPVLAVIVLHIVCFTKFTINGPIDITILVDQCKKYWWTTLLHIQNYYNPNEQCVGHSWYLSTEFQLFTISPFLIYPAWRYGWKYLWSLLALALMSSIYILVMCLFYEIPVTSRSQEVGEFYEKFIYNPTHARLGPWMVGIVLGYVLHTTKNVEITISRKLNALLWILCLSVLLTSVIIIQPMRVPVYDTSLLSNAFYHAFHRPTWACGIAYLIFACEKLKTGGIIRWFLSLPQWQPIARMSLSMYLVHVIYQFSIMANHKDAITYEIWPMLHNYWGDILVTIFLGTPIYLTFEAPFLLVEKYFYTRRKHNKIVKTNA